MVQIEDLRKFPVWESIPEDLLRAILPYVTRKRVDRGDCVVEMGAKGSMVYFIESGFFKVTAHEDDREVILNYLGPGDIFGEQALLGEPRTASVEALEPGSLLVLHRNDFLHVVRRHPEVALSLIATLLKRLKETNQHLAYLAARDAAGRVARALQDLARDLGEVREGGVLIPRSRLTVQELAKFVGLTRETTSRALKILEQDGVIKTLKEGLFLPGEVPA